MTTVWTSASHNGIPSILTSSHKLLLKHVKLQLTKQTPKKILLSWKKLPQKFPTCKIFGGLKGKHKKLCGIYLFIYLFGWELWKHKKHTECQIFSGVNALKICSGYTTQKSYTNHTQITKIKGSSKRPWHK